MKRKIGYVSCFDDSALSSFVFSPTSYAAATSEVVAEKWYREKARFCDGVRGRRQYLQYARATAICGPPPGRTTGICIWRTETDGAGRTGWSDIAFSRHYGAVIRDNAIC